MRCTGIRGEGVGGVEAVHKPVRQTPQTQQHHAESREDGQADQL